MSQYPIYKSLEEACQALGVEVTDVPRDDKPHPVPLADGSSKTDGRIRLFTNNDGGGYKIGGSEVTKPYSSRITARA